MMTNALQMLHTTTAYQGAGMQLLVNEANFIARQLDLKEIVPASLVTESNRWEVDPPPKGIGGSVQSENYAFWFHEGKLRSVHKYRWFEKISPPATDVLDLADRPSLLDTNSAYALAKEWLSSLSVDVAALEAKYPPRVFQLRGKKRGPVGQRLSGPENILAVPLFMIGWGEAPVNPALLERLRQLNRPRPNRGPSDQCPVFMEILGTTREIIELRINDPSVLKRPALQLANAAELLGPTPPPKHFVEKMVGGNEAYRTIEEPDKVEVWLLTSSFTEKGDRQEKKNRAGPARLSPEHADAFSKPLLDFDSYLWNKHKACIVDYGARLRFTRGADAVEFLLCYECDILEVTHQGKTNNANFDPARRRLVKAIQAVFPHDEKIRDL